MFLFFLPPDGGRFFLCVVCTPFTSKVFVGVEVVLKEVLFVALEVLVCLEDGFSGVDLTEPMIPSL